ncbi:MAG: hypothetical protein KGI25_01765 [Thaumarchaeota archaeon]|nr:hypothetical protein [Nitrososphaerota archaeon]
MASNKSNLADIMYNKKDKARESSQRRPNHISDELDEPKHRIANPLLFAKSREVLGNLISKRMKTSGGTDIDWLIEHNGGFMIFEIKIFHDDRILISRAQMIAYEKLYANLSKCHVLFIGHDDIDFSDLNDPVWMFEMKEWKSGTIPHVEDKLVDPSYSENELSGYRIERDFMTRTDIKGLRDKIDSIWTEFER